LHFCFLLYYLRKEVKHPMANNARLINSTLSSFPPVEVSGNMPLRAYGRGRTDRAITLDTNVGDDYPMPAPMSDVHNPTLLRRNMQAMSCDYLVNNPANGMRTHWWHAQRVGLPTSSGENHPVLMQEERARQLGWIRADGHGYNPSALRFGSVLTVGEDQVPVIQQRAADARQPYPNYNAFQRFIR
jgi:hypothetical protein